MEPDPTGLEAGLNPYSYTGNNPTNNSDPTGLDFATDEVMSQGFGSSNPVNAVDLSGLSTVVDNNYFVTNAFNDLDTNIYKSFDNGSICGSNVIGHSLFPDSFISPDTGKAVGRVMYNQSIDSFMNRMVSAASNEGNTRLALGSLPNQKCDIKTVLGSYHGYTFRDSYVTGREAGNILAGINAATHGQSFQDFQRTAGALQGQGTIVGAFRALDAASRGAAYGPPPTYGENNYQYLRSLYGYGLIADPNTGKKW
jgi:filamentous hemagglutinin